MIISYKNSSLRITSAIMQVIVRRKSTLLITFSIPALLTFPSLLFIIQGINVFGVQHRPMFQLTDIIQGLVCLGWRIIKMARSR
ncbi:hypothetical protein OIU77_022760, partial [Salix suchowensis]